MLKEKLAEFTKRIEKLERQNSDLLRENRFLAEINDEFGKENEDLQER
jgi:hypothetical protein